MNHILLPQRKNYSSSWLPPTAASIRCYLNQPGQSYLCCSLLVCPLVGWGFHTSPSLDYPVPVLRQQLALLLSGPAGSLYLSSLTCSSGWCGLYLSTGCTPKLGGRDTRATGGREWREGGGLLLWEPRKKSLMGSWPTCSG